MKLSDIKESDQQLDELLPSAGLGQTVSTASPTQQSSQPAPSSAGLSTGQMDPAQAAQAAKARQEQKKQLQDQIKQTEQSLNALRKQLASLG